MLSLRLKKGYTIRATKETSSGTQPCPMGHPNADTFYVKYYNPREEDYREIVFEGYPAVMNFLDALDAIQQNTKNEILESFGKLFKID